MFEQNELILLNGAVTEVLENGSMAFREVNDLYELLALQNKIISLIIQEEEE